MRSTILRKLILAALILGAAPLRAATITVDDLSETVADDGKCTCREALQNADNDSQNGRVSAGECAAGSGVDTVILPAGTITLGSRLLIGSDLTLQGAGAGSTIIDAATHYNVSITAATTTTLKDFKVINAGPQAVDLVNAAVEIPMPGADVTLDGISVADSKNRGVWTRNAGSTLTILNSSFSGCSNTAIQAASDLVVRRTTVENNYQNGLIHNTSGNAVVENSTFFSNKNTNITNNFGTMTVDFCTSTDAYTSGTSGYGVNANPSGIINISNSIISGNVTDIATTSGAGATLTSLGHNIYTTSSNFAGSTLTIPGTGDQVGAAPALDPMAANGAVGRTRLLGASSPAKNAADTGNSLTVDQNGALSHAGVRKDIGAAEAPAASDTTPPVITFHAPSNASYVNSGTPLLWATVTDDVAIQAGSVSMTANGVYQGYDYDGIGLTRTGTALADGYYAIALGASDTSTNGAVANLSFTVDTLAPTAVVFPANNSSTGVSMSAWAQITELHINPAALTLTVNGVNGHLYSNGSITSTAAPIEGLNAVTLTATDLAGNTLVLSWVFTLDTKPTVTGLNFNSAPVSGTAGLVISGTMFVAPLTVTVKGVDTAFTIDSPTQITAAVPANVAGAGRVVVTSASGSSADVAADDFSYTAGSLYVTTNNDTVADDGFCSCREAVAAANTHSATGSKPGECGARASGATTIVLPAATLTLASDLLASADMTLSGTGMGSTLLDGATNGGVIATAAITLSLQDLTLHGAATTSFALDLGNGGTLNLTRAVVDAAGLRGVNVAGSPSNLNAVDSEIINASGDNGLMLTGSGAFVIDRCTFVNNSKAIYTDSISSLAITNSTFSGGDNGPYFDLGSSGITIDHSSSMAGLGGGVTAANGSSFTMSNSAIQSSSGRGIQTLSGGFAASAGHNVYSSELGGGWTPDPSDVSGVDPNFAALANNGGFTRTMAINEFSPAFGLASTSALGVDQRGVTRPQGAKRDAGAYEATDSAAPSISIQAPADLSFVAVGSSPVWATISDAFGVAAASLTLTVDGSAAAHAFDGASLTRTGAALVDGYHTVTLTASDAAANTATATWAFYVDSLTPTALAFPANGSFTSVSGPAWAQITELNLAPAGLTLTVNGANGFVFSNGSISSTAAPIEGLNAVTLTATDLAGNTLTLSWVYTLDTVDPVASSFPADGSYTNVTASGWAQVTDLNLAPNAVTLTVNGVAGHTLSGGSVTPTTALMEGFNALTLTAADKAGNSVTHPWVFTLDTILPSATVQAPADLTWTANAAPAIWAIVSDANFNPAALTLTVNGVPGHVYSNGSITHTAVSLADGLQNVLLTATDLAGNTRTLPWSFRVDTTAPVASAGSPSGLTNVASQVVSASISDGVGIGVTTTGIVVKLDGAPAAFSFDGTSVTLTANVFTDGTHYVEVRPTDRLGNVGANLNFQFTVITDPTPPVASGPSPVGVTNSASPLIHASLSDVGSGVAPTSVSMTVDGAPVAALASASEVSFSASALLPGVHTVTVDLKDVAGNQATQLVWQFTITSDTQAPTVGNPSPLGVTTTASPFIHVSLTDTGGSGVAPASVSMTVDGVAVGILANASDVSFTASGLADGTHTITVDVADNAGNQATQFFWTFVVASDVTAPVISAVSVTGSTSVNLPVLYASLTDTASGIDLASVVFTLDGTVEPATVTAGVSAVDVSFTPSVALALGVHHVSVDVKDAVGNQAIQKNWSFNVTEPDVTAPVISAVSVTGSTSVNLPLLYASLTDTASGIDLASVVLTLDGTVEPATVTAGVSAVDVTFTPSTALALGVHHVSLDVKDLAGNHAIQKNWSFVVTEPDVTAPVISAVSVTGSTSVNLPLLYASLTDTASGIDLASVVFTLDGTVELATVTAGVSSVDVTFTPSAALALGVHHVSVDVKDLAGNHAIQKNWSFNVTEPDVIAPVISAGSPTGVTTNPAAVITALFTEADSGINTATAVLRLDGVSVTPDAVDGVSITYTASALADGVHTVSVDVKDKAGNTATQLDWQFTLQSDTITPQAGFQGPTSANPVTIKAGTKLDVIWTFNEANPASAVIATSGLPTIYSDHTIDMTSGLYGTSGFFGATLPSLGFVGGSYVLDLSITLRDKAGNVTTTVEAGAVVIDGDIPTSSSPLPTGTVSDAAGNTTISLQLADTGGSVVDANSVKLFLDGVLQPSPATQVTASGIAVSVTYSATGLSAGLHTVTVDYADAVGNSAPATTWTFTMVRDDIAPVVSAISAPVAASPLTVNAGASVNLSYTYTEANPAYISITVRSGATVIGSKEISTGLAAGTATRTDTVDLSTLAASGTYDVQVAVVDTVGQLGSLTSSASVVVDRLVPSASLNVPTGTVIDAAGNTTITLQLSDTGGSYINPASVYLSLDGLQRSVAVAPYGNALSVTYSATGLSAGLHTVSVDFADAVGNTAPTYTWSFTMVRDNVAPVIMAVLSPSSGTPAFAHATGTADVRWSYVEVNPAWVSITVQSAGTIIGQTVLSSGLASAPTGLTLTTAVPLLQNAAPGVYDVVVTMVDQYGQLGTLTSANSVVVDNTAPTAASGLPAGASINQTAAPVVSAVLADAGGSGVDLNSVVLRLDGVVRTPSSLTATLVSFNSSGLADGPHTASVELKDKSGNPAETYSWSFRTDTKVPAVAITAPLPGAYVRGTVALDSLATDAGSGVTKTAFYRGGSTLIDTAWFNGTAWANSAGALSPSASVLWDTTLLADGLYVLKAVATDLVANDGTSSNVLVTVDNTVPVITIDPVFSPTQYQGQTITGSVTEQNLGYLRVNGVLATLSGSAPNYTFSAVVPLVTGANGITVTAGDLGGNGASVVTGITVDPTAAVQFIAPAPSSVLKGTVDLELTVPDLTNTLTLEVSADGGSTWNSIATPALASAKTNLTKVSVNGWRLAWDTVGDGLADANGAYRLRAVAYDQYGVQLGSSVVGGLTVDNTAPTFTYAVLPAPVNVGGNDEVYIDQITLQGAITETGPVGGHVLLEHYNSTGDHVTDSPATTPYLADNKFSHDERLVEGYNRFVYTVFDAAGNSSSQTFVLYYVRPQNSGTICSAGGGLGAPDGTAIQVPANALISCVSLSIKTILRSLLASPADPYLVIVGEGHQVEPVSLVFQAQAQLTLPYTDADLDPDANGIPDYLPSSLKVLFWDGSVWQNVGVDSINTTTKRVTVRTNHLGLFCLAADTAPIPSAPKVYLTKNPFRYGSGNPTSFVYELPTPGKVTIRIYDKGGDEVRTLVDDLPQLAGRFTQVWDGLNNFDRFVGSGIYFFRFEAKLDSGQTVTNTKAIGVLK